MGAVSLQEDSQKAAEANQQLSDRIGDTFGVSYNDPSEVAKRNSLERSSPLYVNAILREMSQKRSKIARLLSQRQACERKIKEFEKHKRITEQAIEKIAKEIADLERYLPPKVSFD